MPRLAGFSLITLITCTYRMGVNKMASVGCSPLSGTDAANGTVLTKRQQLKQQRDKQRQQEFQQEKRCAACWLPLVQGVLPMVSDTPAHVRYVSNDELARQTCMPGGDMYEP